MRRGDGIIIIIDDFVRVERCYDRRAVVEVTAIATTHNASSVHVLQCQNNLSDDETRNGQREVAAILAIYAVKQVTTGRKPAEHVRINQI
jgi:hypothetical protein